VSSGAVTMIVTTVDTSDAGGPLAVSVTWWVPTLRSGSQTVPLNIAPLTSSRHSRWS
jgi:hypothetical protein